MTKGIGNLFELLREKRIIYILNGDEFFGSIQLDPESFIEYIIPISMPYLSKAAIYDISRRFRLNASYGSLSRWQCMDNLLVYCITNNKIPDLLSFLFSKPQFKDKLKDCSIDAIDEIHKQITDTIIYNINHCLYFGGYELVKTNNQFMIKSINSNITTETPSIKLIDMDYIKDLGKRAFDDISLDNFDSAITKSRTILEETFCYLIESKGETPSNKGDIGQLYKQARLLYNMHSDEKTNIRFSTLLSGLEKIVTSIAQMRNVASDAHGVGTRRVGIYDYHTRLLVNSAVIMAEFMLSVKNRADKNQNT